MKKELIIEGCFDLFHEDHKAFITRCLEKFKESYGYKPNIRVYVMSNDWTHRKGQFRPFLDIKDRISAIKNMKFSEVVVREATMASFEYENKIEFDKEFNNTVIAIVPENLEKTRIQSDKYMAVEPINRIHVSDMERILLDTRDSSRCAVRRVGALLIQNGKISHQASNSCSCGNEHSCIGCKHFLEGDIALSREIGCIGMHAEAVVLAGSKVSTDAILLSTTAPCTNCAQKIIDSGVKNLVYLEEWKRLSTDQKSWFVETSGLDLLVANKVNVRKAGV